MTRYFILLFAVVLYLVLSGCDGFTMRKATIDLDQNTPTTSAATVQPNDLQQFFRLIENVAVKNGLKCNAYNETDKYFG